MLNSSSGKIRVLVVDDSAFMRKAISEILNSDPEFEVVGVAADAYIARDKIKELNPDVMTLDIQMPRMDGLEFLEKVMTLRPMPVVMVSTQTEKGATATIQALQLGAVDYVTKPSEDLSKSMGDLSLEIRQKVRTAAKVKVKPLSTTAPRKVEAPQISDAEWGRKIIAIGASTGGVEALTEVICALPKRTPPIVITQHMPEKFTASFARRLNTLADVMVLEAENGHALMPSTVYIAPGSHHLTLARQGGKLVTRLLDSEPVSGHRPSVDVMFRSCAEVHGKETIGVILTGMGRDGAEGLKMLYDLGAKTIGQNEETALVYGMPKAAKELGGVWRECGLTQVAQQILLACSKDERV